MTTWCKRCGADDVAKVGGAGSDVTSFERWTCKTCGHAWSCNTPENACAHGVEVWTCEACESKCRSYGTCRCDGADSELLDDDGVWVDTGVPSPSKTGNAQ